MIQDIAPQHLDNSWNPQPPDAESFVMCFQDGRLLAALTDGQLSFPRFCGTDAADEVYLFSVDSSRFYLAQIREVPADFGYYSMKELRSLAGGAMLFAAFTAYHLSEWYAASRFCGCCGAPTAHDSTERAMVCTVCGRKIYPRINPAVIVGVTDGDRLLITRYRQGYAHNALVAGFTEIGETLEETVAREVMEETGLRVKNIRYYKSQPWGTAQDILMGFFCEADGDTQIRMDSNELKYAAWTAREDIVLQPNAHSLTNEMMLRFKCGGQCRQPL